MKCSATNPQISFHRIRGRYAKDGFALVSTISIMALLLIMAVAMMNLSSISVRESSSKLALVQAQNNARLSLMIAIGELQEEMGPDMRISAESAILDGNEDTEAIEGVAQSR
ncbi:MAG: hypothetical protein QMB90_03290 [Rubritalea sp.]